MNNAERIAALRYCGKGTGCRECPIYHEPTEVCFQIMTAAADALEAAEKRIDGLQKLVDINTKRCEALRKQLRESHESYEHRIAELMPKEAHWVAVYNGHGVCSNCNRQDSIDNMATHCRYCGARMDRKEKDDGTTAD